MKTAQPRHYIDAQPRPNQNLKRNHKHNMIKLFNPLHCLTLSLHILNIKMTVCSYYYFIRKWRQHSLGTTLMRSPAQIKI